MAPAPEVPPSVHGVSRRIPRLRRRDPKSRKNEWMLHRVRFRTLGGLLPHFSEYSPGDQSTPSIVAPQPLRIESWLGRSQRRGRKRSGAEPRDSDSYLVPRCSSSPPISWGEISSLVGESPQQTLKSLCFLGGSFFSSSVTQRIQKDSLQRERLIKVNPAWIS